MLRQWSFKFLEAFTKSKVQDPKREKMDIETVARKCKASCQSIKMKLEVLEKEFFYLKEKYQQLTKENEKLQADLTNSKIPP